MTPLAKIAIFGHPPCTPLIAFQQHPWAGRKSVRYFRFFLSLFFSTRPNEFFQIQAYLIHWFRLLALLFSLFFAEAMNRPPGSPPTRPDSDLIQEPIGFGLVDRGLREQSIQLGLRSA